MLVKLPLAAISDFTHGNVTMATNFVNAKAAQQKYAKTIHPLCRRPESNPCSSALWVVSARNTRWPWLAINARCWLFLFIANMQQDVFVYVQSRVKQVFFTCGMFFFQIPQVKVKSKKCLSFFCDIVNACRTRRCRYALACIRWCSKCQVVVFHEQQWQVVIVQVHMRSTLNYA